MPPDRSARPTVVAVNVGAVRTVVTRRGEVETAIWKDPVAGRVMARGANLEGDDQADRQVHGGPDKAVYAYGLDDYSWWQTELGRPLEPGTFGENLTVSGLAVSSSVVGERWAVGSAVLEVCQPRTPCAKLGLRMGDARFPRRFSQAGRPGAYLRIVTEGSIGVGDAVDVVHRPDHGLTVSEVARSARGDDSLLPAVLAAPELARIRVDWAVHRAVGRLKKDPSDQRLMAAFRTRLLLEGFEEAAADAVLTDLGAGV